jgi:hypothetical protein
VFGSRTIWGHLLKGLLGFAFLAVVLLYAPALGWWTLVPAAAALACFRGCPMCWTVGLVETVLHLRTARAGCVDGSCAAVVRPRVEAGPG